VKPRTCTRRGTAAASCVPMGRQCAHPWAGSQAFVIPGVTASHRARGTRQHHRGSRSISLGRGTISGHESHDSPHARREPAVRMEAPSSRNRPRTRSSRHSLLSSAPVALASSRLDLLENCARHATGGEQTGSLLTHSSEHGLARRIDERDSFELNPYRRSVSQSRHARPAASKLVHPGSGKSSLERDGRAAGPCAH
jgi:hypothetical protein